jgi:superfamily II DNA/RNA helicase
MKERLMEKKFTDLQLDEDILKALDDMGFVTPTKVQELTIPILLQKKDVIVMSKTGSGKTAAFGIPMVQQIGSDSRAPRGLVLTPTRELAIQVNKDIKDITKYKKIHTTVVYGKHNMDTEIAALKKGVAIVVGTPGRMSDHIKRGTLDTSKIEFLVLDEADRMLDMGFIDQVYDIVKRTPRTRTTMMFSATMPSEVKRLSNSYMNNPQSIELESDTMTVDTTEQIYYRVERNEKRMQLDRILRHEQPDSCLIFCNTRDEVDRVHDFLARKRYFVNSIHGQNAQGKRIKTIDRIKDGDVQIVVATDVAARGLHIEDLSLVINYDVPEFKDAYVHRIGRTGRAGKEGRALSLVTSNDILTLYEIEEHVGTRIFEEELPTDEEIAVAVENSKSKWLGKTAPPFKPQPFKDLKGVMSAHQSHHQRTRQSSHKSAGAKKHHENRVKYYEKPMNKEPVKPKTILIAEKQDKKPTMKPPVQKRSVDNRDNKHKINKEAFKGNNIYRQRAEAARKQNSGNDEMGKKSFLKKLLKK